MGMKSGKKSRQNVIFFNRVVFISEVVVFCDGHKLSDWSECKDKRVDMKRNGVEANQTSTSTSCRVKMEIGIFPVNHPITVS